jgi:hypothetical protein
MILIQLCFVAQPFDLEAMFVVSVPGTVYGDMLQRVSKNHLTLMKFKIDFPAEHAISFQKRVMGHNSSSIGGFFLAAYEVRGVISKIPHCETAY